MHLGQGALLPAMFGAVDVGTDVFKRQRTLDKHHLSVRFVGNTLRFQIKRLHKQPVVGHSRRLGHLVNKFSHDLNYKGDPAVMPDWLARVLAGGQILGGVNRFPLTANLKMQFDAISVTAAHLGDFLTFGN